MLCTNALLQNILVKSIYFTFVNTICNNNLTTTSQGYCYRLLWYWYFLCLVSFSTYTVNHPSDRDKSFICLAQPSSEDESKSPMECLWYCDFCTYCKELSNSIVHCHHKCTPSIGVRGPEHPYLGSRMAIMEEQHSLPTLPSVNALDNYIWKENENELLQTSK